MSEQSTDALAGVHPQMLAAQGCTDRTSLGADPRRAIGRVIERGLARAGLTKQEVSFRLGYADQSTVGRWVSGMERPHFDRLLALEDLRKPLLIELCRTCGATELTHILWDESVKVQAR